MEIIVSVIIPCYNQGEYLPEALESILAQSYQHWECIVVDDGSSDNTAEIIKEYSKKDNRIKYICKENGGVSSARNTGIRTSVGTYILPLDGDDKIAPDYISLAVEILNDRPDVKLVYGRARFFGDKNGEWPLLPYSYRELLLMNLIYCSAVFRREDYDKTGGYYEGRELGLEDWEFWINLLDDQAVVIKLDDIVFYYRISKGSRLSSIDPENERRSYDIVFKKHIDTYLKHFDTPAAVYAREQFIKNELQAIKTSKTYQLASSLIRLKQKIFGKQCNR